MAKGRARAILFTSIILGAVITIVYALNMLDQLVNGQLYEYELKFDPNWAGPYWNLLRILQICLGIIAGVTVINLALTMRGSAESGKRYEKTTPLREPSLVTRTPLRTAPQSPASILESPTWTDESPLTIPSTSPTDAPFEASELKEPKKTSVSSSKTVESGTSTRSTSRKRSDSAVSGSIRCSNCGKTFTQPLQMLDFQGDRPRIVSICPFCNEIIRPESR